MPYITSKADSIVNSKLPRIIKVIKLSNLVRDIPYKRIGSLNPQKMIEVGKGSCTPKHIFLASYLRKLGISVKFLRIPFFYKKMPLQYPKEKMGLVEKMPIAYHTALKAKLKEKWRIIDVTWDSRLKGFPVTYDWNGNSNMKLGVVPEKIIEQDIDPSEFEKNEVRTYSQLEKNTRKKFYLFFDEFLQNSRR